MRCFDDGRLALDNNPAERAMRGVALGRRSWLFAGSDEGASCCSPHHVIDKPSRFCWRPSGSGRRDRRILACRRTSSRTRSSCRIIHGAPLQCCLAGRMPSAMRRRMVEVHGKASGCLVDCHFAAVGSLTVTIDGDVVLMSK